MNPKSRLLITGATGYLGSCVLRHCRASHPDVPVWALGGRPQPPDLPVKQYRRVDLRDFEATRALVLQCRPTHVLHLAGRVRGASLADYLSVNVLGTDHLYRALAELQSPPRVVQAGSAASYGAVPEAELPIRETQGLQPVGDYALSKACQDQLAAAFRYGRRLDIIRARLFNVLGPGQPEDLVPGAFVGQLRRCAAGLADRLEVGNTAPRRDFVDAGDAAEALELLLERGRAGEAYNVGSGRDVSIQEVIDELLAISGLAVPVAPRPERQRGAEVARVCADVSKIAAEVGWRAKTPLRQSLERMWKETEGPSALSR